MVKQEGQSQGYKVPLSDLYWTSLQARLLDDDHALSEHAYTPRNLKSMMIPINIKERKNGYAAYTVEGVPYLDCILLYTDKNSTQYSHEGNVLMALETYQTIFRLS
jgi:hypothetical protein